jgi:alpha-mannosidase
VEPANVVVTSFKRSEAGDGLIVRCCEIAGRDTEAAIQMSTPVRSVSRCNLLEDEEAVFWSGAQPTHQVSIPMSAFGIATVKLRQ